MVQTLTRDELYALVWQTPMTRLAASFGLSDVGLRKICKKHEIPMPPLGYWAKKEYGKPVQQTALPKANENSLRPSKITIHEGAGSDETEAMSAARATISKRLEMPAEAFGVDLSCVEKTIEKLTSSKPDRNSLVSCTGKGRFNVSITASRVSRAKEILTAIVNAAHLAGIAIAAKDGAAAFVFGNETISVELVEVADKVEHVATATELKAIEKWDREALAYKARYGYEQTYGRPFIPKWDDKFRGRLAIRLEEVRVETTARPYLGPIIRHNFFDSEKRDIIKSVPKILATVAAIAVAKQENRAQAQRRRLEWQEAEKLRAEAARRAEIEERLVETLDVFIDYGHHIATVEQLLANVRIEGVQQLPARVEQFANWLEDRVRTLKAGGLVNALDAYLARNGLCGSADEQIPQRYPLAQKGGGKFAWLPK